MKKIESIKALKENPVKLISEDWALLSAGKAGEWNGMTVSWGGVGELWGKDVVFVFVRPQRYTKEFIDSNDYFTLSFFDDEYKQALRVCGRKSGRDCDKMQLAGLTGVFDGDTVYPAEARLVIKCKKIAVQKLNRSGFLDSEIEENYSNSDYHYVYIGEITEISEK